MTTTGVKGTGVYVNLACLDVTAEGYLFKLLEHDSFHHGGCRVALVLEVSEF